ncbi:MAG: hypothetical protein OXC37_03890 [Bdellovibrionaceae bacterium]|nr:hypothetical protein [Pseudobdellovibrionaceae bacterium]
MKYFTLLIFSTFLISSCSPIDLDDRRDKRDRYRTDTAEGNIDFNFDPIEEISELEVAKKTLKEDCSEYKNVISLSILGNLSPTKGIRSCIAKFIDEGVKPICEQEKQALKQREYYENKRNEEAVYDIDEYLLYLDESKYDLTDDIFEMADLVDDQCEDFRDEIEEREDGDPNFFENLGLNLIDLVGTSECRSIRQVLDTKGRNPCTSFDFSKSMRRR